MVARVSALGRQRVDLVVDDAMCLALTRGIPGTPI